MNKEQWGKTVMRHDIMSGRCNQEKEEELDPESDTLPNNLCLQGSSGKGFYDYPPEPANKYS